MDKATKGIDLNRGSCLVKTGYLIDNLYMRVAIKYFKLIGFPYHKLLNLRLC